LQKNTIVIPRPVLYFIIIQVRHGKNPCGCNKIYNYSAFGFLYKIL